MANYMADVAKLLGVELDEEFEIEYPSPCSVKTTALFSKDGFKVTHTDAVILQPYWKDAELHGLLNGTLSIKRKPWKPKDLDGYFAINQYGCIIKRCWYNDAVDIMFYKIGNCYRTEKDAEVNRDKWSRFYASDEVLEV